MTQLREDFAGPASEETIQRVAERMRERNIEVVVVDDGDQARKVVLARLPWEDAQVRKAMNIGSFVGKILLVEREWVNGRMTVILVRKPIGI